MVCNTALCVRFICQCETSLADSPIKDIHAFVGTFTLNHPPQVDGAAESVLSVSPLTVENVLWANTVLAAGSAVGMVVYTGAETRAVMNTSHPETKVGLLDLEINRLAKVKLPWIPSFGFR